MEQPWTSSNPEAVGRQLVQLPTDAMGAVANGDLTEARRLYSESLTPYLIGDECRSTWQRRRRQIDEDPRDADWVTRLIVDARTGDVVGRAGFHGQPQDGVVLVGYAVDPANRRQGHARAALRILVDVARQHPDVQTVQACAIPDNFASRAVIESCGFTEMREQTGKHGLEKVYEITVESSAVAE